MQQIGGRCGAASTRPIENCEQRRTNRNGVSSAAPVAREIFRRAAPAPRMRLYRNPPDCRLQRDDKPAACTTFSSPVAAGATWASALKLPAVTLSGLTTQHCSEMRLYRNPPDRRLQRDDKPAACTTFSSPVAAGATWASAQKTPACHSERVDDSTQLTVRHQRRVSPPTAMLHWRPAATYFERHTRSRRSRDKRSAAAALLGR